MRSYFQLKSAWVGVYFDTPKNLVYLQPLPMIGVQIRYSPLLGMKLAYWRCRLLHGMKTTSLPYETVKERAFGRCPTCDQVRYLW